MYSWSNVLKAELSSSVKIRRKIEQIFYVFSRMMKVELSKRLIKNILILLILALKVWFIITMLHTEKSFRNLVKSTRNQIVFTIFRLIWNQTDVRLVQNQSEDAKYNLISGWFDKISLVCRWAHLAWFFIGDVELNWNFLQRLLRGSCLSAYFEPNSGPRIYPSVQYCRDVRGVSGLP